MSEKNKRISLQTAIDWTTAWRSAQSGGPGSNDFNAFLIPVDALNAVLAEMNNPASGSNKFIRAYMGIDESSGVEKLIIVGTKEDEGGVYRDLLPTSLNDEDAGDNHIWDFTRRCPPYCDNSSDLN